MAAVSYHLSVLKNAKMISSTQKGGYIFYQLQHKEIEELLEWLNTLLAYRERRQDDKKENE